MDSFDWTKDITSNQCWTNLSDHPGKSLDFGQNGYTASLNRSHELLQLTAPDDHCGIVSVRGSFSNNPDAILARAQRVVAGKSTFGLQLIRNPSAEYSIGDVLDEGLINFRWPYVECSLRGPKGKNGVASLLSFVADDGTVFQIMRFEPDESASTITDAGDKRVEQTRNGPPEIRGRTRPSLAQTAAQLPEVQMIKVKLGGQVRINCMCQNRWDPEPVRYRVETGTTGTSCTSLMHKKRLNIQLFIDGENVKDTGSQCTTSTSTNVELLIEANVTLIPGKASIIIGAYKLNNESDTTSITIPSSKYLRNYLGLDRASHYATDLLWLDRIKVGSDNHGFMDLCTSAACLEQILHVTSVPMETVYTASRSSSMSSMDSILGEETARVLHRRNYEGMTQYISETYQPYISTVGSRESMHLNPCTAFSSDKNSPSPQNQSQRKSAKHSHHQLPGIELPEANNSDSNDLSSCASTNTERGIAIIRDIVANQCVDLPYAFWQIRFLVKTYNFLAAESETRSDHENWTSPRLDRELSSLEDAHTLMMVRTKQLERIKSHIHQSLVWITVATLQQDYLASPAAHPFGHGQRKECYNLPGDADKDKSLYAPIIIWYVLRHCTHILPAPYFKLLSTNFQRLKTQYSGTMDLNKSDHPTKLVLLFHYACSSLCMIHNQLAETKELEHHVSTTLLLDLRKKSRSWEKKAENAMATSRKGLAESYSVDDEVVDRLALLGSDLGVISTVAVHARRRIANRQKSRTINPGYLKSRQRGSIRPPTSPPWELNCLNHHSKLSLWDDPGVDEDELIVARDQCLRFLTATYTFAGSWDMSRPNIAALWWDIEASSVICSTFLDIRLKAATVFKSRGEHAVSAAEAGDKRSRNNSVIDDNTFKELDTHIKKETTSETIIDILKKQLETQDKVVQALRNNTDIVLDFDWTNFEPPSIFHPDTWIQSLDDTPDLYSSAQTKTVQLRSGLLQYLGHQKKDEIASTTGGNLIAPPEWKVDIISEQFDLDELAYLSVFDIIYDSSGRFTCSSSQGRIQRHHLRTRDTPDITGQDYRTFNFFVAGSQATSNGPSAETLTLQFWIAYLDGVLDSDEPVLEGDAMQRLYRELSSDEKAMLRDPVIIKESKERLRDHVLATLNDSLLDQQVKHRIYFIQRCSPSIVKAFIYMWHTQAIDTFDDHFRDSSNFFDAKKDAWVTSISLSYWGLKANSRRTHELFHEDRDKAPFPPKLVMLQKKPKRRWWRSEPERTIIANEIEEGSASLVVSGDSAGNWWTCSIISSVVSEVAMNDCIDPILEALQGFVHQPFSGRCLVFLALLGALCESLSKEYEAILKELTQAIKLGREVLKRGLDWEHEEDAIQRLKSMLWALEALRVLDDRLADSLNEVSEAKEKMLKYLSQGPGRRHEQLEHQCQVLVEEFEKRYDNLVSVHVKIDQKIVQISRYREGISAVSNLEETHTALKQNDTVKVLTYITIAYLPISFVATLWSIDLISNKFSGEIFGVLLVAFFIGTFLLARSLAAIMRTWDKCVRAVVRKVRVYVENGNAKKWEGNDSAVGDKGGEKRKGEWPMPHIRKRKRGGEAAKRK